MQLILNAAVEEEAHDGPTNDDPASAEDLDAGFHTLSGGLSDRGAVLGTLSFEPGDSAQWNAQGEGKSELTAWTVGPVGDAEDSPVLITEAGTGDPDFVEIQNLSARIVDTRDWVVAVNDANDIEHPPDINAYHSTLWNLPDRIGRGEVLYRSDVDDGSGNFWGENLFWRTDGPGWAMVLDDDEGSVVDFAVWGYTQDEIASLDVVINGHRVTSQGIWHGPAILPNVTSFHSLQRITMMDNDAAMDWDSLTPPSMGEPNPGLDVPIFDLDWYCFTLADAATATLALTGVTSGNLTLELYDGNRGLLGMGAIAANVSQIISNFVDGTTNGAPDTYYAHVTGDAPAEYSLVITRNADFDAEPNHAPATVQDIMPSGQVLGNLGSIQQEKLTASDADRSQYFGDVVSISGDTAIIGASDSAYIFRLDASGWVEEQKLSVSDTARWENRLAISNDVAMIGARWNDNVAENAGAVWVFRFDGTRWTQEQVLVASDAAEDDYFGSSVGVDENTAVVGAYGAGSGAAYVLRFDGSQWVEQQKLTASDGAGGSGFGRSVAIRGDAIIVGTVVAHAYVFRFDGHQWSEQGKLIAVGGMTDGEGCSVAIDGNTALIGARRSDTTVEDSGSAHVFRFDGSQWIEEQKLVASDAASEDRFGQSVALSGDTLVVGAYYDDDHGSRSGSAYVFHFDGSRWTQQRKLTPSDGAAGDRFARSVSISGNTIIMGAYGNDDAGSQSGSAYVFSVDPDEYTINVQAGDSLVITTSTPAGGPGEFANGLDPMVELYDPAGTLVATDDNSAPDGRNVLLTHSAAATGTYTVRVLPAQATCGEYTLHVTGPTGPLLPFEVAATDPPDGACLTSPPAQMTVYFGHNVAASTLDAADLTVRGVPATAVELLDGKTAVFTLPAAFVEGVNQIDIAAGTIADFNGTPIEPFMTTVVIDSTPPRVIASSIGEGEVVPTGTLIYTARFDEQLDDFKLDPSDITLVGHFSGGHAPAAFAYDPASSTLTLEFADLREDAYTLSLLSGNGRFEDPAGNDLDGESELSVALWRQRGRGQFRRELPSRRSGQHASDRVAARNASGQLGLRRVGERGDDCRARLPGPHLRRPRRRADDHAGRAARRAIAADDRSLRSGRGIDRHRHGGGSRGSCSVAEPARRHVGDLHDGHCRGVEHHGRLSRPTDPQRGRGG